jgi:hypothetical membrane protein
MNTVSMSAQGSGTRHTQDLVRAGAWAGVAGPLAFLGSVLLQVLARRAEYDPVSEPVSGLGAGSYGWVQSATFVVLGVLTVLFAGGLHRAVAPSRFGWLGPALLLVTAIGPFWGAVFPLERDSAGELVDPGLHWVGGLLFFGILPLAMISLVPRMWADERWRGLVPYTVVAGVLLVVAVPVMVGLTLPDGAPLHAYVGLLQILLVAAIRFPWQIALAVRMLRLSGR